MSPDAEGRIPPVSIPRIPWQEDMEEDEIQLREAREFEGRCPICGKKEICEECEIPDVKHP